MEKIRNTTNFKAEFIKRLRSNPQELSQYRQYVLDEFAKDQNKDLLLAGLLTIAVASKGIAAIASETNLQRKSIYEMLSNNGNPSLDSFLEILKSLDLKLQIA